ncbi:MAG: NusG domain II-containing protein [Eubacterium sp.]|nr:NusG domain II-containing protein [Eubacterium sp.]
MTERRDSSKDRQKLKKADIILLIGILLLGIAMIFIIQLFKKPGKKVVVEIDGKEVESFYLNEAKDGLEKTYKSYDGKGENTILIKDNKVKVISADCPDKICVKHKEIDSVGESIICLPHRFVVEVKDE